MPGLGPFALYLAAALAEIFGCFAFWLWLRLDRPMLPDLPDAIALPQGARAEAVTFARDLVVVVTDEDEVLIYDRSGTLRDRIRIGP